MKHSSLMVGIPVDIELMELTGAAESSGEPELWGFLFGDRMHFISQIVEGWICDEHKYVEVKVNDGRRFILRQDGDTSRWSASAVVRPDRS